MNPNQDALIFTYKQHRENQFLIGMSFESMPEVNFTGYNSKMSGVTTFKPKGTGGGLDANEQINEIVVYLITESVLELRESGSVVYDSNIQQTINIDYYLFFINNVSFS